MKVKIFLLTAVGLVLTLLGLLWFLQGSDLIRIEPMLCVANCQPIAGYSPVWQVIGLVAGAAGTALVWTGIKKLRVNAKNDK